MGGTQACLGFLSVLLVSVLSLGTKFDLCLVMFLGAFAGSSHTCFLVLSHFH